MEVREKHPLVASPGRTWNLGVCPGQGSDLPQPFGAQGLTNQPRVAFLFCFGGTKVGWNSEIDICLQVLSSKDHLIGPSLEYLVVFVTGAGVLLVTEPLTQEAHLEGLITLLMLKKLFLELCGFFSSLEYIREAMKTFHCISYQVSQVG